MKDPATGDVTELRCSYDPASKGGQSPDGRKVKGTLHYVEASTAIGAEVRLYDHLFKEPFPEGGGGFLANLNPASLEVLTDCKLEPALAEAQPGDRCQFLRHGYFCADTTSTGDNPVFNRTVSLKDSWAKIQKKQAG